MNIHYSVKKEISHHQVMTDSPRRVIKRLNIKDLLEGGRELIIEHNQQDYLLRITRQNKLILTK